MSRASESSGDVGKARQALAEEKAAYASDRWKRKLRREVKKATLPTAAFTVFMALVAVMGKRHPTFRELQALCGDMASSTLSSSLDHLERHDWLTRIAVSGRGNPVHYELRVGTVCECRPGRGHPTTSTQRMRKLRALSRAENVTLTRSKDVTVNGSKNAPGCDTSERHISQVRPGFMQGITDLSPRRGSDLSQRPNSAAPEAGSTGSPEPTGITPAVDAELDLSTMPSIAPQIEAAGSGGIGIPPAGVRGLAPGLPDDRHDPDDDAVPARGPVADRNARAREAPKRRRAIDVEVQRRILRLGRANPGMGMARLGKEAGCAEMTARRYVDLFGIPRRHDRNWRRRP